MIDCSFKPNELPTNTYQLGLRNHPNFSYRRNEEGVQASRYYQQPYQHYQQEYHPRPPPGKSYLRERLDEFILIQGVNRKIA